MFDRIGVALYNDFRASVEAFLKFLKDMDIAYMEIGKEWIPSRKELGEIKDLLDIYELRATLHIPGDFNLAELDERRWKRNILGVLGDLSVCYDLEVESAVLHCGWVSHPQELAAGYARFGEAYQIIDDFARDLEVRIYLENQCRKNSKLYIFEDQHSIDRLSEVIDLDRAWFVLDVGHVGRLGISLDALASSMGDRLAEVHLHDYNGRGQDHLPLGAGRFDVTALCPIIEERSPLIVIENRSVGAIKNSILRLRDVLNGPACGGLG